MYINRFIERYLYQTSYLIDCVFGESAISPSCWVISFDGMSTGRSLHPAYVPGGIDFGKSTQSIAKSGARSPGYPDTKGLVTLPILPHVRRTHATRQLSKD